MTNRQVLLCINMKEKKVSLRFSYFQCFIISRVVMLLIGSLFVLRYLQLKVPQFLVIIGRASNFEKSHEYFRLLLLLFGPVEIKSICIIP